MSVRRGQMHWDTREPCASCPYRIDAKLEFWTPDHFVELLKNDADPIGAIYGCHGTAKKPEGPSICGGYLLDQKKRGEPSIQLRLVLIRSEAARAAHEEITDGGHELYSSIEEMCEANGVDPNRYGLRADSRRKGQIMSLDPIIRLVWKTIHSWERDFTALDVSRETIYKEGPSAFPLPPKSTMDVLRTLEKFGELLRVRKSPAVWRLHPNRLKLPAEYIYDARSGWIHTPHGVSVHYDGKRAVLAMTIRKRIDPPEGVSAEFTKDRFESSELLRAASALENIDALAKYLSACSYA